MKYNSFWRYDSHTYYYEEITDTAFRIKGSDKYEPAYVFKTKPLKYSLEQMVELTDWKFGDGILISGLYECDNYLFFKFYAKKKTYDGYFDKRNGQTALYDNDEMFVNDMDAIPLQYFGTTTYDQEAFSILDPSNLEDIDKELLPASLRGVSAEDNPVLRIMYIKKTP